MELSIMDMIVQLEGLLSYGYHADPIKNGAQALLDASYCIVQTITERLQELEENRPETIQGILSLAAEMGIKEE